MDKYQELEKKNKRKEIFGGLLGVGTIIASIFLGIADFVAPTMVIAYVSYMVIKKA